MSDSIRLRHERQDCTWLPGRISGRGTNRLRELPNWAWSWVLQPALQQRVADDIDAAAKAQLPHRVGLVHLDRFDAEVELAGNFFVAVPKRDQPNDLGFTIRDSGRQDTLSSMARHERAGHLRRDGGIQIPRASGGR